MFMEVIFTTCLPYHMRFIFLLKNRVRTVIGDELTIILGQITLRKFQPSRFVTESLTALFINVRKTIWSIAFETFICLAKGSTANLFGT